MENTRSEDGWETLNEYLKEQLFENKEQQKLEDGQLAIIHKMILEPLERTDGKSWEHLGPLFAGFIMTRWLKLGFLPSQFEPLCHESGLELSATFFRIFPADHQFVD